MQVSGRVLFFQRVKAEWQYQWGIVKTVLDWTIVLYLVMPTVVIGAFMYAEAWQSIELYWSSLIPFPLMLAVLLLLSAGGQFRTYLLEADMLYLLQRKNILHELKRCALFSSLWLIAAGTALLFLFILPILVQSYHLTGMEVLLLYIGILASRLLFMTIHKVISRTLYQWLFNPVLFAALLILLLTVHPVVYGIGGGIMILLLVFFQLSQITRTNRWFQREIEIEKTERTKYIKIILNFSQEVEKEKISSAKRPWLLFPDSKPIFKTRNKVNGLLEVVLKSFLRNRTNLMSYYKMTAITMGAIFVLPLWLKWIVWIAFVLFIRSWIGGIFRKMKASPFFTVIPFAKDLHYEALPIFQKWVGLPAITLTGLLTALLTILKIL
jgi:predicted ABC-type exoprotein transport system permease subunit